MAKPMDVEYMDSDNKENTSHHNIMINNVISGIGDNDKKFSLPSSSSSFSKKAQKQPSTPTRPTQPSLHNEVSPVAGPATTPTKPAGPFLFKEISPPASSSSLTTYECDNISQESNKGANITKTKPMIVNPSHNPDVTPQNESVTHGRSNHHSIMSTAPAMAIDREQAADDQVFTLIGKLAIEELRVHNMRNENKKLKDKVLSMESRVRILEAEGKEKLKKINELKDCIAENTEINKSMVAVVEEYDSTIVSLIADMEQNKKLHAEKRNKLTNERDKQFAQLRSIIISFNNLLTKYDDIKQVLLTYKATEDAYKKIIQYTQEQITKMLAKYEMLKQYSTAKLNHANQELERMNSAHEAELAKLNAMLKRSQTLISSMQEAEAQKIKENDELTVLCNELINKAQSK